MLLAIDIGNTNIVFGIYQNNQWVTNWRIQTDTGKTADEYEVIFRSLFTSGKICKTDIKNIILSSVVPCLVIPFNEMLKHYTTIAPTVIGPKLYSKLPIKILNPYEIGTDLVCNAVAAFTKYGEFTTVVDFGTALTFTTIGKEGEIIGVAIAPGIKTAVNSLAGKTAQLPFVTISAPPSILGLNTVHAIQSGVVLGFAGLADSIIEKTEQEVGVKINVVATGGLSNIIAPLTKNIKIIEELLTLDGLQLIGQLTD